VPISQIKTLYKLNKTQKLNISLISFVIHTAQNHASFSA